MFKCGTTDVVSRMRGGIASWHLASVVISERFVLHTMTL